jgi:hypothetical protein
VDKRLGGKVEYVIRFVLLTDFLKMVKLSYIAMNVGKLPGEAAGIKVVRCAGRL